MKKDVANYFLFGKRRSDFNLMIDFSRKRAIIKGNTGWIEGGVYLETVPPGSNGFAPGMVLISSQWDKLYFLIRREGWSEDQYFEYAQRLMAQRGIAQP